MSAQRIAIIIPAYNEAESLPALLSEIARTQLPLEADVVVVNDSSTDATRDVLEQHNCTVLDLPINLGIGGAVHCGLQYAHQNGYIYAFKVDGDGQHDPANLSKLLEPLMNDVADVTIGSRYIERKGFQSTVTRRAGIAVFRALLKLLVGTRVTDPTSGFRGYNSKAIAAVQAYYPDEYPEPESIVWFARSGIRIQEIPVEMRARQGGKSSIRAGMPLYYMLKVSLAVCFTWVRAKRHL